MTKNRLNSLILSSLLLGGISFPAVLSADQMPTATVVLDVSIDGGTLAYSRPDAAANGAHRGDSYVVSGWVYAAFSIPDGDDASSFLPDPTASIGSVVMNGILVDDPNSDSPMISSTHVFVLENADGLVTQGLEGAAPQFRALLGGTGQYSGAIGQVTQQILGTNATGGYNIRFTFQLVQLNPQDNSMTPQARTQQVRKLKAMSAPRKHR